MDNHTLIEGALVLVASLTMGAVLVLILHKLVRR